MFDLSKNIVGEHPCTKRFEPGCIECLEEVDDASPFGKVIQVGHSGARSERKVDLIGSWTLDSIGTGTSDGGGGGVAKCGGSIGCIFVKIEARFEGS